MSLPVDDDARKALPLYTFLTEYFFLAFLAVVRVAVAGDKQHKNEGTKIRWAREKSTDQMNTAMRHICDYSQGVRYDADGQPHLAKAIWRLSAQLQIDEERARGMHCGCKINDVPVCREVCNVHKPGDILAPAYQFTPGPIVASPEDLEIASGGVEHLTLGPIITTRTRCAAEVRPGVSCDLQDGHAGRHKTKVSFCIECGVDMEEGVHAPGCLRLRQYW